MGRIPPLMPAKLIQQLKAEGYTREEIIRMNGLNPNRKRLPKMLLPFAISLTIVYIIIFSMLLYFEFQK